jgi:sulfatase maturation enzyme AslB (radical SAM superfamily)
MVLWMTVTRDGVRGKLRGTLRRTWARGTQESKRAMVRLGIVPRPFRISIDITDRCNFRCPTCSKWRHPPPPHELGLEEWRIALDRLRGFPLLREIAIGGGEPLLHADVLGIIELAHERGFRTTLISNGWLIDQGLLESLERVRLDTLIISLNSLTPSVHDETRGKPGSHDRIMNLVENWCATSRTQLLFSTIVLEPNCGELVELAQFVRDEDLRGILFQVLLPTEVHYTFSEGASMPPIAGDWTESNPLWVRSLPKLGQEIDALLDLQAKGYPVLNPASQLRRFISYYEDPGRAATVACLGTHFRLHIDPLGDMRLCYGFPPIGNVLRDDPRQAWKNERATQIRSASIDCSRPCRLLNCNL